MKKEKEKREHIQVKSGGQVRLIAVCLILSVVIFLILLSVEKNMLAAYEKSPAIMAKQEIPAGTVVMEENVNTFFEQREVEKTAIPAAGFEGLEELYGYMPVFQLEKGTVLTRSMMKKQQEALSEMREPVIAGFTADDLYQVVGGVLRAGDVIHIYSVDKETEETQLIWPDIVVAQVFDSSGAEIQNTDTTASAQRVNIYMEKENVESLYSALAAGSMRVVKDLK